MDNLFIFFERKVGGRVGFGFGLFKKKQNEPIYTLDSGELINLDRKIEGENNSISLEKSNLINSKIFIKGNNNKVIIRNVQSLSGITIELHGDNHRIELNDTIAFTDTKIFMRGLNHSLVLGKCAMFGGVLWYETSNCSIHIGDWTTIERAGISAVEPNNKVTIGNDCMFSHDLTIRTSDSHPIYDLENKIRINESKDVIIGDHVWIGAYSHILKGININGNSVVGINSVVTKDVPSNCVVAGNPAKIVKRDIMWTREPI